MEKIVDVKLALSTMNNLEFILIKLYKEFLANNKNLLSDLENLLDTNIDEARRHVHSLKGISTNLGSIKMYEVSKEFEDVIKSGDIQKIKEDFTTFKTYFEKMYSEITEYLKES